MCQEVTEGGAEEHVSSTYKYVHKVTPMMAISLKMVKILQLFKTSLPQNTVNRLNTCNT